MTVIGITGTSGKTSTVHLLYEILKTAGKRVSMISTVHAVINGEKYDTGFHVTTPSPWQLQKFMKKAANGNSEYFILEVTSHGLDQYRVFGASIDLGVITNITHEHFDYHGSLESYREAKAKILQGVEYAVLNSDDKNFSYLKKKVEKKIISFAINNKADYKPSNFILRPKIPGKFNIYNCLAAASVAQILKINRKIIEKTISEFKGIKGRMELVENNKGFKIIVDFAHKPDALEQVLKTARTFTERKLIVMFGCAGLRDRLKRSIMGEIAGKFADYAVLTAEDPRTEDVRSITEEIAQGCLKAKMFEQTRKNNGKFDNQKKYFWRIPDRQEAINFIIKKLAQRGDVLLFCGKGHEQSMCYGYKEYPWDERKAIEKALYGTVKTFA